MMNFLISRQQEITIRDAVEKERVNENLTTDLNLGREDKITLKEPKNNDNIKMPEFKWKSEIHSLDE